MFESMKKQSIRDEQLQKLNLSDNIPEIETTIFEAVDKGIFLYGVRRLDQITKETLHEKSPEYFEILRGTFNRRVVTEQNGDGSDKMRNRPYEGLIKEEELAYQLQLNDAR